MSRKNASSSPSRVGGEERDWSRERLIRRGNSTAIGSSSRVESGFATRSTRSLRAIGNPDMPGDRDDSTMLFWSRTFWNDIAGSTAVVLGGTAYYVGLVLLGIVAIMLSIHA
jgi:hypothetical protein